MSRGMISANQYEDILPALNAGGSDGKLKRKPAAESQKSSFRGLANFKDKVIATISGPSENSDSEANGDTRVRGHKSKGNVESTVGSKTDNYEIEQSKQKIHRNAQKSIPIVLKTDLEKEISSVMDDRPPVPAKNHARPQVQHKLDNRRERERELRNQNRPSQDQRQDQLEDMIKELQEELQKVKEHALEAEEEVQKGREIQNELMVQLKDLISHHECQHLDSDKLSQQNILLSKELSKAHEHLNRDQAYQTLLSERRISERNETILKSKIKLLTQDMGTLEREAKRIIQEKTAEVEEARAELQRRVQEADNKVARVQEQRDQAVSETDRVRQELDRLVQQLASQTSLDVYHFDDVYFQTQFSSLRGNIKDWAHRAFSNGQFTSDRSPSLVVEKAFNSMTAHWESYLYSDEHRSTIVQAFVWTFLMTKVFGGGWEWSKKVHPFGNLLDKYLEKTENQEENLRLFHEWRSTGARLAVPQGTQQNALERVSARLKDTVDALQNYLEPWSTMGRAQSHGMLLKILKEAVQLDINMQQQRASFVLLGAAELWKQSKGLYDSSTMEVRLGKVSDGKKEKFMELLIAPLLLKSGTSDGRNYAATVIIEKAQVDIDVPSKKHKGLLKIGR